jgi:alpha-methylacyl-CoA racemase
LRGALPNYQIYEARQGWVAIAMLEPHFQQKFLQLNSMDEMSEQNLRELFMTKTASEWHDWAFENELPLVKVKQEPSS